MTAQTPESAHYHLEEGHLCVDFINTAYIQVDQQAPFGYQQLDESLTDLDALAKWAMRVEILTTHESDRLRAADPARIESFRELREALRRLIRAHGADEPIPESALATINRAIPPVLSHTRIGTDGDAFQIQIDELCGDSSDPDHILDHVVWAIGQSTISLLTDPRELAMIRECPADDCGHLFRDTSHGRRRWCSMKSCGNRAKVQRFREKQKSEAEVA